MQGRNYRGTTLLRATKVAPQFKLTHFSRRKRSTILLRLNLFATFLP